MKERTITYRGSITDLATDIAYELTPDKALELIRELQRFMAGDLVKFHNAYNTQPLNPENRCARCQALGLERCGLF